jgi:predicted Zn-dependent protease
MKKLITQGVVVLFVFFGTWFALAQIDWEGLFKVKKVTEETEEKLGDLIWDAIEKSEEINNNTHVVTAIDSIVAHICTSNKIDKDKLKVHIINKEDINAFALPNGHLIVYTGLILNSDNQEELTGVICHEIAHIELSHVMKKLVKEIGLSVLISMTTGNSGGDAIKQTAKMLSSSAFDRSLEKEADIKAVDYMLQASVNPEPFADFLYKISEEEHEATKYLVWMSTHPESKERAKYIIEYSKGKIKEKKSIITLSTWEKIKEELKSSDIEKL